MIIMILVYHHDIGIDFNDFSPSPLSHPPEASVTTRSRSNFFLRAVNYCHSNTDSKWIQEWT